MARTRARTVFYVIFVPPNKYAANDNFHFMRCVCRESLNIVIIMQKLNCPFSMNVVYTIFSLYLALKQSGASEGNIEGELDLSV